MARTQIGLIIDELVTLEAALTGTGTAYDETPENLIGARWINFPMRGTLSEMTGWSEDVHTIGCAYVKARALLPADEATMRPLITQFADTLSANQGLGSTIEHILDVRYTYGLIEVLSSPEEPMFGVLFEVDVIVKDTITVGL